MASFTKLTISVLKVFPSYTEIKRVMVDNDMNLESHIQLVDIVKEKSRIRETKHLSTDADSRTDTILERLRDLSKKKKINFFDRLRD